MSMPFPGMDPYLEHPVLWESVHARLIPCLANQLQPRLDPRYVASIEERVFIERPQRRIPDIWIWVQKIQEGGVAVAEQTETDTAVVVEVDEIEVHQKRIEILDMYNNMKLVGVIEVVSPTNKLVGPGGVSYQEKQQEILGRDCHFIEIDLLRHGEHVASVPDWRTRDYQPYHYLVCVSRWPARKRFELCPRKVEQNLPRIKVPLAAPDPDVPLDIQAALEQVYLDGRYLKRLQYDEPCEPPLSTEEQTWAWEQVKQFRQGQPSNA